MDTKTLLAIPPVLIGVALVAYVGSRSPGAGKRPEGEQARAVRTIEVPSLDVVPRVRGMGTAQPAMTWQALAEVSAQVAWIQSELKPGVLAQKGTLLLRLDRSDIDLAIKQHEAALRTARAELAKLDVTLKNDQALLEIETRALAVSRAELKRARDMAKENTTTGSAVDERERATLGQAAKVRSLNNSILLNAAQREVLEANVAQSEANLEVSRRDLTRVEIRAPFNGRVASISVEAEQFAAKGQVILEMDSIERTEVPAQFTLAGMQSLIAGSSGAGLELQEWMWKGTSTAERFAEMFQLSASVSLRSGDVHVRWPAKLVRVAPEVDPLTRTSGMVVAVDRPYALSRPGTRPPLVKGMFCEVELRAKPQLGCVAIPRTALREGDRVYVMDAEKRLRVRSVKVGLRLPELVTIVSGLQAGETLVLSDPIPAVEGVLLESVPAPEALERLRAEASGS